jgi:hypothetical protein
MTFLNAIMLLGLAAIAIPIIIHILNRRKARVVEWGAMQFLQESLASRKSRILIEEIILMCMRCLLLGLLALALARPFLQTGRLLAGEGRDAQDIAILVDGSLSMTLDAGGKSNFQRALEEAHQVVEAARPGDAMSLVLAGPTPSSVIPSPLSNRQDVHRALDELTNAGGSLAALEAFGAATITLAAGANPAKKIVLITDGQSLGWDLPASQRWAFLAKQTEGLRGKPLVIVRTLQPPRQWKNAALAGLSFSRSIIGTDRPVSLTVTVANTGMGAISPEAVELLIDGAAAQSKPMAAITEGASSSVVFEPQFDLPGPHIVTARIHCEDDLPGDDAATRVVDVAKGLNVLVIEGVTSSKPLESSADFLRVAMAPAEERSDKARDLICPKVVSVADVAGIKDLAEYAVVVLADVPRLPAGLAKSLAEFADAGGGLLIGLGEKADKDFYNAWKCPRGKGLLGCKLIKVQDDTLGGEGGQEQAAHLAPNRFDHPALRLVNDPQYDLGEARVKRHWLIQADGQDESVAAGGFLDNGEPALMQRKLQRGFVLTAAFGLDKQFSELPLKESFTPLVHELLYYLAAPSQRPLNLQPGQQLVYAVPGQVKKGDVAEVIGPDGKRLPARLEQRGSQWLSYFHQTARPGLYRLALSDAALGELASRPAISGAGGPANGNASPPGAASMPATRGVPFAVLGDPDESKLQTLGDDDFRRAGQYVQLAQAQTLSELTSAIRGGAPGREIWQYVALAVLALLVAEIAATRYIAIRRKTHVSQAVVFGSDAVDAERFGAGGARPRKGRVQEVSR